MPTVSCAFEVDPEITIPAMGFSADDLTRVATAYHEAYVEADPFPHIVMDGLLPEAVCRRLADEFPAVRDKRWNRTETATSLKLASQHGQPMSAFTRSVLAELNSGPFLEFLERLTGIAGLIPDPYLFGGGQHQIVRNGFLKVHADFNRYERVKLDRRLNVILYLNEDWDASWGGHLQLWDRDMAHCVERVLPLMNRVVVFSTTDFSYHGHPDPLTCPADRTRKSLALYYYTNGRPEEERSASHTTIYRERPGEAIEPLATGPLARLGRKVRRVLRT